MRKIAIAGIIGWCVMIGLSGCDGDGGDTTSAATATATSTEIVSGNVADGYLVGAKVCLDANGNGACDTNETYVVSGENGAYNFAGTIKGAGMLPVVVEVNETTIDRDTNLSVGARYTLRRAAGQTTGFISPLTTLIANEMDLNNSLSPAQAEAALKADLGVAVSLFEDYVGKTGEYAKAHTIAQWVARNMQIAEVAVEANATAQGIALDSTVKRLLKTEARRQIRIQMNVMNQTYESGTTYGTCPFDFSDLNQTVDNLNVSIASSLSASQRESLIFMWNEEKMAREVYAAMYAKWGMMIFANIGQSEQAHVDSVSALMVKYGIPVPADTTGVYTVPAIQSLYESLIAQGLLSSTDALKVGKSIEEADIADLDARMADTTVDMKTVYENLRAASLKHLEAFNKQLAK